MKRQNRTKIIVAIFLLVIALSVATVIALSVLEIRAHKHEYAVRVVAPTCVDDGYTLHTCACGESFKDEYVNALGHDFAEDFTVDSQPDCTAAGSKSKHCSRCESTAEVTVIPANGHSFGEWNTISERSCTAQGIHMRVCGACGESVTKYETPLGHDLTCTTDEYNHQAVCNRCDFKEKAKHAFEGTVCADCKYEVHPTLGLRYELNDDGASYKVTGIGEATDVTDLVIFSTHEGLPVTEIGYEAFRNCKNIKSICLYGIETISGNAFTNCSNVEKIVFPDTLFNLGIGAFNSQVLNEIKIDSANPKYHCVNNCLIETETKLLRMGGIQSIIPDDGSVTALGSYAFGGRGNLTQIIIPDTVTRIGESAFWYCGFTEIEIPSSVKTIGVEAFNFCHKLTKLKLSEGLESISTRAFHYCDSLKEVEIPSTVVSISNHVFYECANLSKVKINEGVQSISNSVFEKTAITELTIPASVTKIRSNIVAFCDNLTSLTVDSSNQIYHSVNNCVIETATKTLIMGCNVSVIPDDGNVTVIGEFAFEGCNFTRLNMPDCITEIQRSAFSECVNLTELPLTGNIKTIEYRAFMRCDGLVDVIIPDGITEIGSMMFGYCANLESVRISESVKIIGRSAFTYCNKLKTVEIPSGVTIIESSAFAHCNSLVNFTVPGNVKEVESGAFRECSGLKKVVIEEGVEKVGNSVFNKCTALEIIELPKTFSKENSINYTLFADCPSLNKIKYAGTAEEWNLLHLSPYFYNLMPETFHIACSDGIIVKGGTVLPLE